MDPVTNPQYVPPSYDVSGGGSFASHPALEASGAHVVDQLTGVGFGVTVLIISVGLSLFGNFLQFKRNNSLVDQILSIVPSATASVLQAVSDFKQAIKDMKDK